MNKILSLLFLIILMPVALKTYNFDDENLDVARRIICEYSFLYGETEIFDKQNSMISNNALKFSDFNYINLKRQIVSGKYDMSIIGIQIEHLKSLQQKAVLYVLLAKDELLKSNLQDYNLCIAKAFSYICSSDKIASEKACFEIIEILLQFNEKLPQEDAMEFLLKLSYSPEQILLVYSIGMKPFCIKKYFNTHDPKSKYGYLCGYIYRSSALLSAKGQFTVEIGKNFYPDDFVMQKSNTAYYKYYIYPLYAYLSFCLGDTDSYEKYHNLSISKEQLCLMKFDYYNYVEYASKIFFLTNSPETSLELLETLPVGHQRNYVLKRILKSAARSKKGLLMLSKSKLLN